MNRAQWQRLLEDAAAAGLIPAGEAAAPGGGRPWPVVLLTGLGAWLAALPLLGFVALATDLVDSGVGAIVVGSLLLAAAVMVLRGRGVSLFIEQLAVPGLLAGAGLIALGLLDSSSERVAAGVMAVLALGVAAGVPQAWLRALLGAAAAVLIWLVITDLAYDGLGFLVPPAAVLHLQLLVWIAALQGQQRALAEGRAGVAAALEAIGGGWLAAVLAAFALWSGTTFLLGANLGAAAAVELAEALADGPRAGGAGLAGGWAALSAVLALGAGVWLARRWPGLRQAWCAGVVLVLAGLALFLPALGAVLLAAAICAAGRRAVLALTALVAAAWIIGAFYYQLAWPLATKAGVLVGAAAVLGTLAAWGARVRQAKPAVAGVPAHAGRGAAWVIALGTVAVVLVAVGAIVQKEQLIAHGRTVFVPLAPVDPRSLMQGDYMALNFLAWAERPGEDPDPFVLDTPRLALRLDARGVVTARRPDDGSALQADEVVIRLVPRAGRWMLVTDAFYFPEGEGERWAAARFGEFRVDADGKALLVGLRGEDLAPL
ncbi:GDYXXLXY domain-containing protein [Azoarcus olearius]|uniref:Hypothetical membrane protein n=1 Tax=Azoarcus sp. (strain BH72) TaxID=418699 RepID=A1K370_AZOSB|nr:GDYXXLXY domain-containing protein [Azoarcus olearius]CAL93275.1 hypothetical membrane protein [Azoarcus olearius]